MCVSMIQSFGPIADELQVDGDGWVSKAEAQQILDEICVGDGDNKVIDWDRVYDNGYNN